MPAQASRVGSKPAPRPCKPVPAERAGAPAVDGADRDLRRELEALVAYIRAAKREIAAFQPEGIRENHIRPAADELDAIVAHTEEATGAILGAAEGIESTARALDGAGAESIVANVTRIYESCNFQDITGQRVAKVVGALKDIEEMVTSLAEAFGALPELAVSGDPASPAPACGAGSGPAAGRAGKRRPDDDLLNGPQLPGAANSQEDVDALLDDSG